MNYIKGFCKTNLDGFNCSGEYYFVAVPLRGDSVKVRTDKGKWTTLKVVHITHQFSNILDGPSIEVELHN
jgi:hypothetical protein